MTLQITLLFIGLFAVIQAPFAMLVGARRAKTGIQFSDGGNESMLRWSRAHGNFVENVPIVLLAMAAAEITLMPALAIWVLGIVFLAGRVLHAVYMIRRGWGAGRAFGMILTVIPMIGFGGWALFNAL